MKAKPNLDAFLNGGAVESVDRRTEPAAEQEAVVEPVKPEPTVQKLFRLRWDSVNALKRGATEASIATGRRVTETEIVEDLIRRHFGLDK